MSVNGYAMVKTVHNSVYDGNCDISAAMSWTEVQFRRDLLLQKQLYWGRQNQTYRNSCTTCVLFGLPSLLTQSYLSKRVKDNVVLSSASLANDII